MYVMTIKRHFLHEGKMEFLHRVGQGFILGRHSRIMHLWKLHGNPNL